MRARACTAMYPWASVKFRLASTSWRSTDGSCRQLGVLGVAGPDLGQEDPVEVVPVEQPRGRAGRSARRAHSHACARGRGRRRRAGLGVRFAGRSVKRDRQPASGVGPGRGVVGSVPSSCGRRQWALGSAAVLGERAEQRGAVGHRPRHRPDVVERRRQREHTGDRDAAVRGLDRADAAQRGRDAQRATGVAAQRRRGHAGGERRAGAPARAAGDAIESPRVAHLVGGAPAANSCVCVWPSRTMPRSRRRCQAAQSSAGHVALEHLARGGERQARRRA